MKTVKPDDVTITLVSLSTSLEALPQVQTKTPFQTKLFGGKTDATRAVGTHQEYAAGTAAVGLGPGRGAALCDLC